MSAHEMQRQLCQVKSPTLGLQPMDSSFLENTGRSSGDSASEHSPPKHSQEPQLRLGVPLILGYIKCPLFNFLGWPQEVETHGNKRGESHHPIGLLKSF